MIPDFVDSQLWPSGDLDILGNFFLELHHLLLHQQLLHEEEGAVVLPRQKKALKI